jgi:hypothetical protein
MVLSRSVSTARIWDTTHQPMKASTPTLLRAASQQKAICVSCTDTPRALEPICAQLVFRRIQWRPYHRLRIEKAPPPPIYQSALRQPRSPTMELPSCRWCRVESSRVVLPCACRAWKNSTMSNPIAAAGLGEAKWSQTMSKWTVRLILASEFCPSRLLPTERPPRRTWCSTYS